MRARRQSKITFLKASKHAEKNKDNLIHIDFFVNVIGFSHGLKPLTKVVSLYIELCQLSPRLTHPPTVFCPFLQKGFAGVAENIAVKWRLPNDSITDVLHVAFWCSAERRYKGTKKFSMPSQLHLFMAISMTALQYEALEPCVDSLPGPCIACLVGRTKADPTGCNFKC